MAVGQLAESRGLRVVSLLPAATEIVYALGCGELLVGRSHECDYPARVKSLPSCSRSILSNELSSEIIHRTVQELLARGEPLYEILGDELQRLQPDLILTQGQCEVCAIDEGVVSRLLCDLNLSVQVCSVSGQNLSGVFKDIITVASALGVAERGASLVAKMQHEISLLRVPVPAPRVLLIEWLNPLMAAGNWMPELVRAAGGEPLLAEQGKHSPCISAADILDADPDVLGLIPCGFAIARSRQECELLTTAPWWGGLTAVKNDSVFLIDGNAFGNRPGPRLLDTVMILNSIFLGKVTGDARDWCKFSAEGCSMPQQSVRA